MIEYDSKHCIVLAFGPIKPVKLTQTSDPPASCLCCLLQLVEDDDPTPFGPCFIFSFADADNG
jgi:hypothetical protein